MEDIKNLKKGFFTNGYFSVYNKGEVDFKRLSKDSKELATFIDKILDKNDHHPPLNYTGDIYK